jgi:hypothetical protein
MDISLLPESVKFDIPLLVVFLRLTGCPGFVPVQRVPADKTGQNACNGKNAH